MAEEGNKIARKAVRTSYLSSVVSIAMVLFMAGVLAVLLMNARMVSDHFKESFQVMVFLQPGVGERQAGVLAERMASHEGVRSADLVTADDAAVTLSEELGEDFVTFIGSNPLSHTIDVRFASSHANVDSIALFEGTFSGEKAVQEIRYEEGLVENINRNIRRITVFILAFCVLLFFVMGVLINNTIRLTLYAKRLLIKSMQLVGATRGFIRKPFLWKGVQSGFWGAVLANFLLVLFLYFTQRQVPELFGLGDFRLMSTLVLAVFAAGIIIAVTSTFFAINKYLRKRYDELF